jgi:hypothetical protein
MKQNLRSDHSCSTLSRKIGGRDHFSLHSTLAEAVDGLKPLRLTSYQDPNNQNTEIDFVWQFVTGQVVLGLRQPPLIFCFAC